MAAITQPSAFGAHSGRRYGSFANKSGAQVVAGPYCVVDLGIFVPGKINRRTSNVFKPAIDRGVFKPGAIDQEVQI